MKVQVFLLSLIVLASGYELESVSKHGQICNLCIDTLEAIKSATTSEEIENLITDTATTFCRFTPKSIRSKCEDFFKSIIGQNFGIIRDFTMIFEPKDLCKMIRLCPKNEALLDTGSGTSCTACRDTVSWGRYLLTKPNSETLVKTYIDIVCRHSGRFMPACAKGVDVLVSKMFLKLREIFSKYEDDEICQVFNLCQDKVADTSNSVVSDKHAIGAAVTTCDVCTDTLAEVKSILEMKEIETLAQDVMRIQCSFISVQILRDQCTMFYKNFVEECFYYWRIALDKYDIKAICTTAHLCAVSNGIQDVSTSPLTVPNISLSSGPFCLICEDTVSIVRHIVTDPHLEKMINSDIKFGCRFTVFFHSMCETAVDTFTSTIFEKIRNELDTSDDHNTCVMLLFCGDQSNKTSLCDVCKSGFEELREVVTSESLKTFITNSADVACRAYGPARRMCVQGANRVINYVFDILHKLDDISGEQFCSTLHLCKKPAPVMY